MNFDTFFWNISVFDVVVVAKNVRLSVKPQKTIAQNSEIQLQ